MKFDRLLKSTALAAALSVSMAGSALAAQISGAISFTGFDQALVCSASPCNAGNLTGVDFPAGPNNMVGGSGTGDFSGLSGFGTIQDINFLTFPNDPIWSFNVFSFVGNSVANIDFAPSGQVTFDIFGILSGAGFDDTPGVFSFSGNQQGGSASWSASSASTVPEPGMLGLLGLGLLGLGAALRRRKA